MSKNYSDYIRDINTILMEKKAQEDGKDPRVLGGNVNEIKAPGVPSTSKEDDEAVAGAPMPLDKDNETKSVDYAVKSSKEGNELLKKIYNLVYKKAEDSSEESCKEEEKVDDSETPSEEDIEIEIPEEEVEDSTEEDSEEEVPVTEEEKKAMLKMSSKKKSDYMMSKKAGIKFAKYLHKSGMLEKIALAYIAPHLDKLISFQAGQLIADLEKKGALVLNPKDKIEKTAALYLKTIVENAKEEMTKKASVNRQPIYNESPREIIKQAAQNSTKTVINDLFNLDMGKNVNEKLARLIKSVNP